MSKKETDYRNNLAMVLTRKMSVQTAIMILITFTSTLTEINSTYLISRLKTFNK